MIGIIGIEVPGREESTLDFTNTFGENLPFKNGITIISKGSTLVGSSTIFWLILLELLSQEDVEDSIPGMCLHHNNLAEY